MREGTDRNVVYASLCVATHILKTHSARGLQRDAAGMAGHTFDCFANGSRIHVVEKNCLGSVGQGFFELVQRAYLNFDWLRAHSRLMCSLKNALNPAAE